MNHLLKTKALPVQVLLLGAAAAAVRGVLYLTAADEKNLLICNHPLLWVLWLICAAGAVLILLSCRKKKGSNRYEDNFDSGVMPAAGCWCMAAGILLAVLSGNALPRAGLVRLWNITGILAAAGLGWAGYDRLRSRRPNLLTNAVLCLFLALHLVSRYQPWSGNPQIQDWLFSLLATVGLTLTAYHHSAFCAGSGQRRLLLATGLLTLLFCCTALPHTDYFPLYLGGSIWTFTNLCRVTPVRRKKPEPAGETTTETE